MQAATLSESFIGTALQVIQIKVQVLPILRVENIEKPTPDTTRITLVDGAGSFMYFVPFLYCIDSALHEVKVLRITGTPDLSITEVSVACAEAISGRTYIPHVDKSNSASELVSVSLQGKNSSWRSANWVFSLLVSAGCVLEEPDYKLYNQTGEPEAATFALEQRLQCAVEDNEL